jgi:hypothetical protein
MTRRRAEIKKLEKAAGGFRDELARLEREGRHIRERSAADSAALAALTPRIMEARETYRLAERRLAIAQESP